MRRVHDGLACLQALELERPDLLVLHASLDRMSGTEVLEAWLSPHTPFQVGRCRLVFESPAVQGALAALQNEQPLGLCARSDAMREVVDALGRVALGRGALGRVALGRAALAICLDGLIDQR